MNIMENMDGFVVKPRTLKSELKRQGYTLHDVAALLGISYQSLYRRMNYLCDWKLNELRTLSEITGLSIKELSRIAMR